MSAFTSYETKMDQFELTKLFNCLCYEIIPAGNMEHLNRRKSLAVAI